MTEQPRITPEDALAAYEQAGLRPKQFTYVEAGCACPIGALHVAAGRMIEAIPWRSAQTIKANAVATYGVDYVGGFMDGFDGTDISGWTVTLTERERQGYEDGKAVWAAVQHLAAP